MKKEIILTGHDSLFSNKKIIQNCPTPWGDIWIKYKKKKKTVYLGPCFIGLTELRKQIRNIQSILDDPYHHKRVPHEPNEKGHVLFELEKTKERYPDEWINDWKQEIETFEEYLRLLTTGEKRIIIDSTDNVNNVYVGLESFNRKQIEPYIELYLKEYKGLKNSNLKLKWKEVDFIIWST